MLESDTLLKWGMQRNPERHPQKSVVSKLERGKSINATKKKEEDQESTGYGSANRVYSLKLFHHFVAL